jgi:Ca2+:H+ antiporter
VLAIFLSILITGQVAADGETNWLEGVQLLAVYVILAIVFYFLPDFSSVGT